MNGSDGTGPVSVVASGVSISFGASPVLAGADLALPAGSVTALLGPSGCGKTTILRVIAGLEVPSEGTVVIGDRLVTGPGVLVEPERRRVGLVFQHGALFPHLDVARNVGFGLAPAERRGGERVDAALELVGLAGFGERSTDSLSGGQAQRVALARALAPGPSLLLLDEPFANLDALLRRRLRDEVAAIVAASGVTALVVTHDREEAFAVADRVAIMREGRIVQAGSPRRVYREPVDDWVAAMVGEVSGWPIPGAGRRPEELELVAVDAAGSRPGSVVRSVFTGADVVVSVALDAGPTVTVRGRAAGPAGLLEVGSPVGVRPLP